LWLPVRAHLVIRDSSRPLVNTLIKGFEIGVKEPPRGRCEEETKERSADDNNWRITELSNETPSYKVIVEVIMGTFTLILH